MKKLLAILDELPEIALENVRKLPTTETLDLPKQNIMLFGHEVELDALQQQDLLLSQKKQIVTDWQEAAKQIQGIFKDKNFPLPVVVPKNLFSNVCKRTRLLRLENMDEHGNICLNFLRIDKSLLPFHVVELGYKRQGNVDSADRPHFYLFDDLEKEWRKLMHNRGYISNQPRLWVNMRLENPDIVFEESGKAFSVFYNVGLRDLIYFSVKTPDSSIGTSKQLLPEFEKNKENLADPYWLYSLAFEAKDVFANSKIVGKNIITPKIGRAVFPKLPQEFQSLLFKLKTSFPQWPVYTAADPDFFRLVSFGAELREYTARRIETIGNFVQDVVKKLDDYVAIHKQLEEKYLEQVFAQGVRPKQDQIFLSEADIQRALQADADPIFYMPISFTHKHIAYDMVAIYGQCGESPHEKAAIEELQKISHTAFMGTAAN